MEFHENPSIGSRVVPCGETGSWTVTTKSFVAFRNFANAPKSPKAQSRAVLLHRCATAFLKEENRPGSWGSTG